MKNQKCRIPFLVTFIIAATILMTACGAKSAVTESMDAKAAPAEMFYNEAPMAAGAMAEEAYEMETSAEGGEVKVDNPNRKLIKTVHLEMETKEIDLLFEKLVSRVEGFGGYVESSNINRPSSEEYYYRSGQIVARIPVDRLDEFVEKTESDGNITYKSENVEDVTLRYTDTEAHRDSLIIERDRLNELLKDAETVSDIIEIESRLGEVRAQLDSYESQLRIYDNQINYSTVNIFISEVVDYSAPAKETIGERIKRGFVETLQGLKKFGEDLLVGIVAFSPVLILIAVIIVVVVVIVRKKIRKKPATKEEEKKTDEE